jgi:hypothetical protein
VLRAAVSNAERSVEECETRAAALRAMLEDGSLYATADGARRATSLQAELAAVMRELDAALESWSAATESLEKVRYP